MILMSIYLIKKDQKRADIYVFDIYEKSKMMIDI